MTHPLHPDFREGEYIPVDSQAIIQEILDVAQPGRTIEKINAPAIFQLAAMAEASLDGAGIPFGQRADACVHATLYPVDFGSTRCRNDFASMLVVLSRGASKWEIVQLTPCHGSSRERKVRMEMTHKQKLIAFKYSMRALNITRRDAEMILEGLK